MNKYIITGATGLVGNNVINLLLHSVVAVKALLLPGEDLTPLDGAKIEIAYGNVLDRDFVFSEIEENCTVLHIAGIVDISSDDKSLLYKVNVEGVKNIADACLEKHCKLVYVSSVHAITEKKHGQIMDENAAFDPNKVVGDYAKSKAMATKYVFEKCAEGLDGVVVFPSGIVGARDFKLSMVGKLILDIANKDIKARVNGGYSFVDVKDVASGIVAAANKGKSGEGYILCGGVITIDGIFSTVNKYLGRKSFVPKIATWFVKLFSGLAELYYKVRKQKPLFTKYSLYTITSNHEFSNAKARRELDFNPRSPETAVISCLKWLLDNRSELFKPFVLEEYEKIKINNTMIENA